MGTLFHHAHRMGRRPTKRPKRDPYGAWLLFLRREAGLSQEDVSLRLKMIVGKDPGATSVSKWERTGNLAGRDYIPALAEVLGVSLDTLLQYKKPSRNRPWHFQGMPKLDGKTYEPPKPKTKPVEIYDVQKMFQTKEEYDAFLKEAIRASKPPEE